jgi:subtilisin family serine protease
LANPITAIDVEDLHHAGYDGSGITIAVLDSGVDMSHPALATKSVRWLDLVYGRPDAYDDYGHGTAVAALALGFDSSAPYLGSGYGASLMAVKVTDQNGDGLMDTFNQGIQEVLWYVDIISVSLGWKSITGSCVVKDGRSSASIWTGWAVSNGRGVVVAAGNEGDRSDLV